MGKKKAKERVKAAGGGEGAADTASTENTSSRANVQSLRVPVQAGANMALVKAAYNGLAPKVAQALKRGADPDFKDPTIHEETALIQAARVGTAGCARLLLEAKASVDYQRDDGDTAVFKAAQWGQLAYLQVLIKHGANVNLAQENGLAPLFIASQNNHTKCVLALIQARVDIDAPGKDGRTALIRACDHGNLEIVCTLVKHGASVNKHGKDGEQAIWVAAQWGYLRIIQTLLDAGADGESVKLRDGKSALHNACQGRDRHAEEEGRERFPETGAYTEDTVDFPGSVTLLLQHKANVNLETSDHCSYGKLKERNRLTPLVRAAAANQPAIVKLLLQADADATWADSKNVSAMYFAAQCGNSRTVRLLLEAKADPDPRLSSKAFGQSVGVSPLYKMVACLLDPDSVRRARETGALPPDADSEKYEECMKLLLDGGADPNSLYESEGLGLLHNVTKYSRADLIRILLERKADPNLMSAEGPSSPLWHAVNSRYKGSHEKVLECVSLLLDAKANATQKCVKQMTPIERSVMEFGKKDAITKLLHEHAITCCDYCGAEEKGYQSMSMCGGCRLANYCCREHMKEAWKAGHKDECAQWKEQKEEIRWSKEHISATGDGGMKCTLWRTGHADGDVEIKVSGDLESELSMPWEVAEQLMQRMASEAHGA